MIDVHRGRGLEPELRKAVIDFFEVEVERTERFQLAFSEMLSDIGVAEELLEEISIPGPGMFGLPGLHGVALDELVGSLPSQSFADKSQQDGLRVPHPE